MPVAISRPDEVTNQRGTVVGGYRIGPLLGRGGMSVVFEVTHPMLLSEPLAMKVMVDSRLQSELAASAIYAHAKTMATIANDHLVRTIDAGRLPTGEPFVVMERLNGGDLAEYLRASGPLPIGEALRFVIQACDGLAQAHRAGLVHGDIKPSNLVVAFDAHRAPRLKIIDFAPAVPRENDPSDPLMTCSPGYASPEQLGARKNVDARADVWALGAVLYELITGKRAFEATSLPEMVKAITGKGPPPIRSLRPDAPRALEAVVKRCLAREREDRYADVMVLRDALAGIRTRAMQGPEPSAWKRRMFLGALGPLSAVVSMTIVRLLLAVLAH